MGNTKNKASPEIEKIKKQLRERLRIEAIKRNIPQADLGEMLETHASRVNDILHDRFEWASLEYLIRLLNNLNVKVEVKIAGRPGNYSYKE